MSGIPGGFGETQEATEETQKLCDQVKTAVEKETGKVYDEFKATKYRKQIVHGINFLIKVHVGGEGYIHLKVFRDLSDQKLPDLVGVQQNKTEDDPLQPF